MLEDIYSYEWVDVIQAKSGNKDICKNVKEKQRNVIVNRAFTFISGKGILNKKL